MRVSLSWLPHSLRPVSRRRVVVAAAERSLTKTRPHGQSGLRAVAQRHLRRAARARGAVSGDGTGPLVLRHEIRCERLADRPEYPRCNQFKLNSAATKRLRASRPTFASRKIT